MSDEIERRVRAAHHGLPEPTEEETALARARFLAAAAAAPRSGRGVVRRRVLAFALAAALAAAAFGGGYAVASGNQEEKPASEQPDPRESLDAGPGFLPAVGWDVVVTGTTTPPQAPAAVAANIPLSTDDRTSSGPPAATARRLGRNGVLFYVVFRPRLTVEETAERPQKLLPLQLRDATVTRGLAGMPATGSTRRLLARVGRYDVDVHVFFGARKPPAGVLAEAAQQLGRLVVPACPAAQPLTEADLPAAETFLLGWLRTHYQEDPRDLAGARATASLGAEMPRGGAAAAACGDTVRRRTVEVDVVLPRLEQVSASLSQLSYFVSKTSQGWVAWQRIH
jgi:hypothetical protein